MQIKIVKKEKEEIMQNVKVNQRSKQYEVRPEHSENRNWFNLSNDWKASFTMGKLAVHFWDESMPGDYYKINAEVMMRFAPLYLPIMHRVNLALDYFFVPYRIVWTKDSEDPAAGIHNWEDFIMNKGNQLLNPFVQYTAREYGSTVIDQDELPMYMGAPSVLDTSLPSTYTININALPLAAYYMIYDQYYRNDQIQSPIMAQEDLQNGTSGNSTFVNSPADELRCVYRNWNRDLVIMITPTPQEGAPVQVPMYDIEAEPDPVTGLLLPSRWVRSNGDPSNGSLVTTTGGGAEGATADGTDFVGLDIQMTAAPIAQFRFASIYQEYLERALRTGDRYSDWTQNFWHTDPYKGTLQLPQFLGTKKGRVVISEVMSTTQTETLKVGSYAGQALALESTNDTIEYHCLEHGVVIGLVSVYPDSGYMQGLDKVWTRSTYLDYPDPRFALIGDEEVLKKEIQYDFINATMSRNDEVYGYRERMADKRFKNDVVAGLFRTTLNSFHLARIFNPTEPDNPSNGSVLNSYTLECRPRITDVFQVVEGEDEIYAHIFNDVKVQRMLPRFGIPAL